MDNEIVQKKQYSIEDFKAFNYVFHGKRDTDVKIFDDNRLIIRDDIFDLNRKISTKLNKENVITNLFSLNLVFFDGSLKEYSNFEVFQNEDFTIKETTQYLTLEYDFSVQLPFYSLPQRHTLKLRIGGAIGLDELLKHAISGKEMHELNELSADVVCKVDFINYHLANELKNIIKDWYEALPRNNSSNNFVRLVKRNHKKLEEFFKISMISVGCLALYYFTKKLIILPSINDSNHVVLIDCFYKIILTSAIVIYTFYSIGSLYADRISSKIVMRMRPNPVLRVTKGDENKVEQLEKNNKTNIYDIVFQIIIGLTANGLTFLIGEFLTKK
jgi:hypothetical protein